MKSAKKSRKFKRRIGVPHELDEAEAAAPLRDPVKKGRASGRRRSLGIRVRGVEAAASDQVERGPRGGAEGDRAGCRKHRAGASLEWGRAAHRTGRAAER